MKSDRHQTGTLITEDMVTKALATELPGGCISIMDIGDPYYKEFRRDLIRAVLESVERDIAEAAHERWHGDASGGSAMTQKDVFVFKQNELETFERLLQARISKTAKSAARSDYRDLSKDRTYRHQVKLLEKVRRAMEVEDDDD